MGFKETIDMGYFGLGIYDNDYALDAVYDLRKTAKLEDVDATKMSMSAEDIQKFESSLSKVMKKLPKRLADEVDAIDWQVFGCFFTENKRPIPKDIKEKVLACNEILILAAADFHEPLKRLKHLLKFRDNIMKLKEVK